MTIGLNAINTVLEAIRQAVDGNHQWMHRLVGLELAGRTKLSAGTVSAALRLLERLGVVKVQSITARDRGSWPDRNRTQRLTLLIPNAQITKVGDYFELVK